jgi:hypothetical protein
MEDGDVVAEGQRVATQTAHRTKQHPAKQGEMRRAEGADESGCGGEGECLHTAGRGYEHDGATAKTQENK